MLSSPHQVRSLEFEDVPFEKESFKGKRCRLCQSAAPYLDEIFDSPRGKILSVFRYLALQGGARHANEGTTVLEVKNLVVRYGEGVPRCGKNSKKPMPCMQKHMGDERNILRVYEGECSESWAKAVRVSPR
jgi:hypothetical protein